MKEKEEENVNITSPERRKSTEKNVKDDSSTPHIYFLPIISSQYFRGHIISTSNYISVNFP